MITGIGDSENKELEKGLDNVRDGFSRREKISKALSAAAFIACVGVVGVSTYQGYSKSRYDVELDRRIQKGFLKGEKTQIGNGAFYFEEDTEGKKIIIRMSDGSEGVLTLQGNAGEVCEAVGRIGAALKRMPNFPASNTAEPLAEENAIQKVK